MTLIVFTSFTQMQPSELRQAILEGRTTAIAPLLEELGEVTSAMIAADSEMIKVEQLGQILSQAGRSLHDSLTAH